MKKSCLFAACVAAMGLAAGTARAMSVTIYNDEPYQVNALLTAQGCHYPKPLVTISKHGSQTYTNLENYHCLSAGRVYLSKNPLTNTPSQPLGGDYQLVEYTFSNSSTPTVGYDFSAVDSLDTLPLAVEASQPIHSNKIGWMGMSASQAASSIQTKMADFNQPQGGFPGWPYMKYNGSSPAYKGKMPGGYNLFALTSPTDLDQTTTDKTRQYLAKRWCAWYEADQYGQQCEQLSLASNSSQCQLLHQSVQAVLKPFQSVVQSACNVKKPDYPALYPVLGDILGFVNMPGKLAPQVIGLLSGVPTKADINNPAYKQLVYPDADQANAFDPYVSFIHKALKLHVYAFSIDDAIGNLYEPGYNGISIEVGGVSHLPDPNPYQPAPPPPPPSTGQYHLNMAPGWGKQTQVSVCGQVHTFSGTNLSYPFSFPKGQSTCQVKFSANLSNLSFTLQQGTATTPNQPKPISLQAGSCQPAASNFCKGGVVISQNNIDMPGGSGPQ